MASLYLLLLFSYFNLRISTAVDSITAENFIRDSETIVSSKGTFKLAFFSPPNSTDRYVGIWFNNVSVMNVVWVANTNNPLNDTSGVFKISEDGNLQILNGQMEILWTTNVSHRARNLSKAQLLDSGNLVLLSSNNSLLWQSFDHRTDTILPKMSVTFRKDTYQTPFLQSWRSPSDPSKGIFTLCLNSIAPPEITLFHGDQVHWRTGPWNGNMFIGAQYNLPESQNHGILLQNHDQGTITLTFPNPDFSLSSYRLNYNGTITHQYWDNANRNWKVTWKVPADECNFYSKCGEFGSCNTMHHPICRCLEGFHPKKKEEWERGNWSSGCTRTIQLQCGIEGAKEDVFLMLKMMKVPANTEWFSGVDEDGCRRYCLRNCSCLAYAYDTGLGCMSWSRSLIDIQDFSSGGAEVFLRLAPSKLGNKNKLKAITAATAGVSGTAILVAIIYFLWKKRAKQGKKSENYKALLNMLGKNKGQMKLEELSFFEFNMLAMATNDFQESNKLGEGGFGQVFRGKLADGNEIAVKRLSLTSKQGLEEFLNEAAVVSKLQHRNLVKFLGCCIEDGEKILIYEYMPNKSLDAFLFDLHKQALVDWKKRFKIIEGICRGLLYLHRDSRLRIIHRDLKASNILLDEDLNPKIADFGMARIFEGKHDQASTKRVVGTYGYMSPEYAMEGRFSEKSDVFSFGVLLLEIISGKRNNSFWDEEQSLSLLGYAWKLCNQGNMISLIDSVIIYEPSFEEEILRCIQVALLCVQEFPKERPDITTVISMIQSETADLPSPKQPGFTLSQFHKDQGSSKKGTESCSTCNISITTMSAR